MAPKRGTVLETVYNPRKSGHGTPTLDLVFVHGLNGDRIQTWTHSETGVFWPADLLPAKQPRTRVLTFGYNADIYENSSVANIRVHARSLMTRLRDKREKVRDDRPIVFVAHSLGGLLVKQALRFADNETPYNPLEKATRGLLLFGTPHLGSDEDRWLSIAQAFAPLGGPAPAPKRFLGITAPSRSSSSKMSPLVAALTRDSSDIADICEDFRMLARHYAIVSIYETAAWPGTRAPIVDKTSALMNLEHEDQLPLEANHVDMCRFEDARDRGFDMVYKSIRRAAKGMQQQQAATVTNQYIWVNK